MSLWWLFASAVLCAWVLTRALRRYALTHSVMDIPNERSSHSLPTPRGGGIAIVVSFLLLLGVLAGSSYTSRASAFALAGAGAWIALIGFLDDHGSVQAKWRLLAHFLGAIWALYWMGGLPALEFFGVTLHLGWLGYVIAALYLVWLLNLYNFMDGIDGIAGVEAICVSLGGAILYCVLGEPALALVPVLLSCAVIGFLCWNFPSAKIFMGDAGSGFLGMVLGIMSLQAAWFSPHLLWSWLILLGVFIVDATYTLFHRLLRGDKVYEAHRSHAYQFASRKYGSHFLVTISVLAINVFWLYPLAWMVATDMIDGTWGVITAYVPLIAVAVKFQAGQVEE